MSKAQQTRDALRTQARNLFWTRGYSNVSLREISAAAGVDVALVSRYFGSKRGLFEATLADLPGIDSDAVSDVPTLIDAVVRLFAEAPRDGAHASPTALILMNAHDPEVGAAIRDLYNEKWQVPLSRIIGDPGRAALFSAAMLGVSVAEKSLHLAGIAPPGSACYAAQMRALLNAAVGMRDAERPDPEPPTPPSRSTAASP